MSAPGAAEVGPDFDLDWIQRAMGRAERRQVVVLAVAFAPARASDPEEIVEEVSRRRTLVTRIVGRLGGTVYRIDPDRQLACWGWPATCDADTRLATLAALEIAGGPDRHIRCGLEAGIAVAMHADDMPGGITIVGDAPTDATALQRLARWGEVVVGERLRPLIDGFALEPGADTGRAHWLVRPQAHQPAGSSSIAAAPLVGRRAEVEILRQVWSQAASGSLRLLHVEGEAGAGKSALVRVLGDMVVGSGASLVAVACRPEHHGQPLVAAATLLGALTGEGCTVGSLAHDPVDEATTAATLAGLITVRSAERPLALVVEDTHWADTASSRVLAAAATRLSASTRALVVTTSRTPTGEGTGGMPVPAAARRIAVPRLGRAELERMLQLGSCAASLGSDIRRRIVANAQGLPQHALELARIRAETHDRDAHHRVLARPNRLNPGLTARADALGPLKPVAQAAAVLGRELDARVLAAVLGVDLRRLSERLEALVELGILKRHPDGHEHVFRFAEVLQWSQLYGAVLKGRRHQMHAEIAAELEQHHLDYCRTQPEVLALHLRRIGNHAKAFEWWRAAARQAADSGSAAAVVSHVNEALAAKLAAPEACSNLDEAELLSLLGVHSRALRGGASSETVSAFQRALELVEGLGGAADDLQLGIALGIASSMLVGGDVREAAAASARLLDDARRLQRKSIEIFALRLLGTAELLGGRSAAAAALFGAAAALYDRAGQGDLLLRYGTDPGAITLAHLASAEALAGNAAASRVARRRALEAAAELGHPHTSANVLGVLTLSALHLGEDGVAVALARVCRTVAEQHGHEYWATRGELVTTWHTALRMPAAGIDPLCALLDRYRSSGAGRATVLFSCLAAEIAIAAGQPERALDLIAAARQRAEMVGELLYLPETLRLEAAARQRLDPDDEAAEQLLARAEAMARAHGSMPFVERAVRARSARRSSHRRRPAAPLG